MRDAGLAVATLGPYLLSSVVAMLRPAPYLPPSWAYLLTTPPLLGYVGYRALVGPTLGLGDDIALAVLALTLLALVLPLGPWGFGTSSVPAAYYPATGVPLLGFVAASLSTRLTTTWNVPWWGDER